jgi:hypothetical protein
MKRTKMWRVVLLGVAALAIVGGGAHALAGSLKTIDNNTPGEWAGCESDGRWTFWITNVAGSTGVEPPSSVTALLVGGGTLTVPLTDVIGDSEDYPSNVAYYRATSATQLTGDVQAEINEVWDPDAGSFGLQSGPCAETTATISAQPESVQQRGTITVAGLLTSGGVPLGGQPAFVRWHNVDAPGKGIVLGPFTTDADGEFTTTVTASRAGPHHFSLEYNGDGPTGAGQFPGGAETQAWSLPAAPRPSSGPLSSTAGTVFTPSQRSTTVLGAGYNPNDSVAIVLYRSRILLGVGVTDDGGNFAIPVQIPEGVSGVHELASVGIAHTATDLYVRYLNLRITVKTS